ncbi:MAG: type II CAAX endopeptidase family protein [Polyangiaceae bacterium]
MNATLPQPKMPFANVPLAPRWHTALIVSLMLVVATLGAIMQMRGELTTAPPPDSRITLVYLPTILVSWFMAIYCFRIGRPKSALRELIGRTWTSAKRALLDIAIGLSFLIFIDASETIYAHFSHAVENPALAAILPQSIAEKSVWVLFAFSAGFCEEVIYRGYLRAQFAGFFRSVAIGVVVQGLLFGIAHGEQGITTALRFALYGIGFGVIAVKRQSLLPGIVCHFVLDLSSGFLHH